MPWIPGQRSQARALEQPFFDVPAHLKLPLLGWAEEALLSRENAPSSKAVLLQFRMPADGHDLLLAEMRKDDAFLLSVIEAMVEEYATHWVGEAFLPELENLLSRANSAYRVHPDGQGIEMRVTPGVREQVEAVVAAAPGSSGDHLTEAWNRAYRRTPDPVKAYSESIKAVESALAPIVAPNDTLSTLGRMLGSLRANPGKWEFLLSSSHVSGVETLTAMLTLLWNGQKSRHGGNAPTTLETLEEARAAVGIAVTVVQFCASGAFRAK